MMPLQPGDALGHGLGLAPRVDEPVPHAGELHRQLRHLVQAAQVVAQGTASPGNGAMLGELFISTWSPKNMIF